jgi:hypothetical protein
MKKILKYKATNYAVEFSKSWSKNGKGEVHYIYQEIKVKTWVSCNPGAGVFVKRKCLSPMEEFLFKLH